MTKAASSFVPQAARALRLLPALLLMAALLATLQFLVSDPDAGSGMGGTGRFGGESGLGGTGGPLDLGFDLRDDEQQDEQEVLPAPDAAALIALASTRVDVERLRTEPQAPSPSAAAPAPVSAPAPAVALLSPAALRAQGLREQPPTAAAADASLRQMPAAPRQDVATLRAEAVAASAARTQAELQASAAQHLLLAETATALELPDAPPQTVAIDVRAERREERLRLSLPARPDLPERHSLQAPRVPVPPRGIPAPPVRPMRW